MDNEIKENMSNNKESTNVDIVTDVSDEKESESNKAETEEAASMEAEHSKFFFKQSQEKLILIEFSLEFSF